MRKVKALQKHLKENGCDALIVEDLVDLYYLTGLNLSLGTLLVEQTKALLLVDGRYIEHCKKKSPFPVKLSTEHPLDYHFGKHIHTLAFDKKKTPYARYLELAQFLKKANKKRKTPIKLKALDAPIELLRLIKTSAELSLLKKAAALGSLGFDYICSLLKEGITEREVATELYSFWKKKGGSGFAFEPIIAFGKGSSMPHYKSEDIKLKKGDPVLLDIGVTYQHYHSDMTRVVFFGKPKAEMKKIYEVVKEAQLAALKKCKAGVAIPDVDHAARSYIEKKGYSDKFNHGLGHGIGIEVHEAPDVNGRNSQKLEAGMVITIEPGIYLPNTGGVRIEDTIIITKKGYEDLTNRPKELLVL